MANYQDAARQAARRYGLDEGVFLRQIRQESGFNPNAVSPAGAIGIAQIMPATAKGWGVNPRDPHAALNAAAKNMAGYVKKYGSYRNALIAYNAGPGAVGRGSLPAETQNYIKTILGGRTPGTGSVRSGGSGGGGGGSTSSGGTTTTTTGGLDQGTQQSVLPLIQALTESQSSGPPAANIQAPSFTAHPVLPEGFGTVSGGGGPAPKADIGALAAAVKTLGGNVPSAALQTSTDTPATDHPSVDASGTYPGMRGNVKFNPNADRPGVKTQPITKEFLSRVAGFSHRTISVGTGTNHNRMTTSGNVSDHWTGHAADLPMPVDSKIGDLTAAHALEAAGVPWGQAYRMAQKGGVFNITPKRGEFKGHRVQVLWKTMVGGNHHNHVHVGIR